MPTALCQHPVTIRLELASDPTTPADILATLARDPNGIVREAVVHNCHTPTETLEQLACAGLLVF